MLIIMIFIMKMMIIMIKLEIIVIAMIKTSMYDKKYFLV